MMRFALGAKWGSPTGGNIPAEPPLKRSFTNNDPRATLPRPTLSLPRKCFLVMFILFSKNSFAMVLGFCYGLFHIINCMNDLHQCRGLGFIWHFFMFILPGF